MAVNNAINNTLQTPFTLGSTSVTATGTQLNLLNSATLVPINKITVQVFTSNGTYTPTSGMQYCTIEVVGGGGGGGGAATNAAGNASCGTGGSGGGYARKTFTAATIGASQTVTIGTGGTGGSAGANNGSAGGNTSVGSLISATAGSGGTGGTTLSFVGAGNNSSGTPGVGLNGDINMYGFPGSLGLCNQAGSFGFGGIGGGTYFSGQSSAQPANSIGTSAAANTGVGGNGGGIGPSTSAVAGGNGGSGIAIITEFLSS